MALQRLRGLVGSMPNRLDLRERLAELYRLNGNPVEAGRWSYLCPGRREDEVRAFEKAHRDAYRRMVALRWKADEERASTEFARERLRQLRGQAESELGTPLDWTNLGPEPPEKKRWWARVLNNLAIALFLATAGIVAIGLVTAFISGLRVVVGWLS
jgi:hypothetical protein